MSTSPIGTRVPTLAPNSIIRAGIPLQDNFNATDVAVSLESLLASGVWTPTVSAETNLIATPQFATFIKVGNIVSCSIQLEIQFAAAENSGGFELSLPVASNFTSQKELFGLFQWSYSGIESELVSVSISSETTNGTCLVGLEVVSDELNMAYATLQFQYEIV